MLMNCTVGLQRNTGNGEVNTKLLAAIGQLLKICDDNFNNMDVSTALYGLQRMSSDSAEVRGMISVLAAKVRECKDELDAQAVGNDIIPRTSALSLLILDRKSVV